jgi:hypothetical protein
VKRELDAYTLRWASRRAAKYERELRGFMVKAPTQRERDMYERAALTAFVLGSGFLRQAKALEARQPSKLTPATTLCGPVPATPRKPAPKPERDWLIDSQFPKATPLLAAKKAKRKGRKP